MRSLALVVVLIAAACSSDPASDPGTDSDAAAAADAADDSSVDASAACAPGRAALPDDGLITLDSGGRTRRAYVHLPADLGDGPAPVVLNFHGFSSNASQQRAFSVMDATADEHGFIVVYPEGVGSPQSWNAGACCGEAVNSEADDVGLVVDLLAALEDHACIDRDRVYATGFSNGGFLSHRLACELGDRIAAIAPVAGVIAAPECEPSRPMPVLMFHGTADTVVPYAGSLALGFPSVADTTAGWVDRNGCDPEPSVVYDEGDVSCEEYAGCDADATVRLCTIALGGHTWPNGTVPAALGHTTTDVDADEMMWSFFEANPRP